MMQIKRIVLYSRSGKLRTIEMRPGQLNIITGTSKTGKSAIGRIIEYVLASKDFPVPVGAIRNTVLWYGLVVDIQGTSIFLARPDPDGKKSTDDMFLLTEPGIDLPQMGELSPNTDAPSVRAKLAQMIGIVDNLYEPGAGKTRLPLEARLVHALLYCFQGQNVIANQDVLFHRQSQEWIPQAIRDTFPYFLGAVDDDRLSKSIQLRRLRREIRLIEQDQSELDALRKSTSTRMLRLLDEAKAVGLVESWNAGQELDVLSNLSDSTWESASPQISDPTIELRDERRKVLSRFQDVRDAIRVTERYRDEAGGFGTEARHQIARLKSVNLLPGNEADTCPICNQLLPDDSTSATNLIASLKDVQRHIEFASQEEPKIQKHLRELEAEEQLLSTSLAAIEERIDGLVKQSEELREQRNLERSRGRVIGRISLFLESLNELENKHGSAKSENLQSMKEEAASLSFELDEDAFKERLHTLISSLSRVIGDIADRFELEHKGHGMHLDLRQLTLVIDQINGSVPLTKIGSGDNWVGYHLSFFLALHKWFITNNRPVPSFLFIDQPTQAYFPPDSNSAGQLEDLEEDDERKSVRRMFKIMLDVVNELSPDLQLIVTDHADLAEEWFSDCVVERWRGGQALIPQDWLDEVD